MSGCSRGLSRSDGERSCKCNLQEHYVSVVDRRIWLYASEAIGSGGVRISAKIRQYALSINSNTRLCFSIFVY